MISGPAIASSSRRYVWCAVAVVFVLLAVGTIAVDVHTHEMPVPMDIQLPLLMKVLSADRELRARAGDELVIGVFYQERYRASLSAMESILEVADRSLQAPLPDQTVRLVPVPIDGEPNWRSLIVELELDVCYVAPLRAVGVDGLLSATRSTRAISCTGVPDYIEAGVAFGFDTRGGKPEIVINVDAAKAEGIDFSSQLLKLARIIDKD